MHKSRVQRHKRDSACRNFSSIADSLLTCNVFGSVAQPHTHTYHNTATPTHSRAHTHTRMGAIGFPAEMRELSVGGWSGRRSLGEPGAVCLCLQHFPMSCVCVWTADVIELFIDFHFNRKKCSTQSRRGNTWARTKGRQATRCQPRSDEMRN